MELTIVSHNSETEIELREVAGDSWDGCMCPISSGESELPLEAGEVDLTGSSAIHEDLLIKSRPMH
jgi:hypothetical protein